MTAWQPDDHELDAVARSLPAADADRARAEEVRTTLLAAAASRRQLPRHSRVPVIAISLAAVAAVATILWLTSFRGVTPTPDHGSVATAGKRQSVGKVGEATFQRVSEWPDYVVHLDDGRIAIEVATVGPGERFRVITSDAEVEVRGTKFEVAARHGLIAEVMVKEGTVEVRADHHVVILHSGETWTAPQTASRDVIDLDPTRVAAADRGSNAASLPATATATTGARDAAAHDAVASAHDPATSTSTSRGATTPRSTTAAGITTTKAATTAPTTKASIPSPATKAAITSPAAKAATTSAQTASTRAANGSTANGSTASGSTANGSTVHGSTVHGSTAHSSTANTATATNTANTTANIAANTAPAVATAPKPGEDEFRAGWTALRNGDPTGATKLFATACSKAHDDAIGEDACFWTGAAAKRANDLTTARAALARFVARFPSSARAAEASALLGWLLYDAGELDAAEAQFHKADHDRVPKVRDSATKGLEAITRSRAK